MKPAIYILSALTTLACAWLLLRGYARTRQPLLLWSGLCFVGLTFTDVLVFADLVLLPNTDLFPERILVTTISLAVLVYGLVWETR